MMGDDRFLEPYFRNHEKWILYSTYYSFPLKTVRRKKKGST
jgi:hypothetical protein